jgi:hypothetical protein
VDPQLAETIRLAWGAIHDMTEWMGEVVRAFPQERFRPTRQREDAGYLGWLLFSARCSCGMQQCPSWHDLRRQPDSGLGLRLFVRRAVIGAYGLCANSITQGMYYLQVLRADEQMLVANVELRKCPACRRAYEGMTCPAVQCRRPFTPDTTEVIAQPRLFIQGVYVPVQRWACRGSHYYPQAHCHEEIVEAVPAERTRLHHGEDGVHDQCPWSDCPNGRPEHPQRGTRLWVYNHLPRVPNGAQAPREDVP